MDFESDDSLTPPPSSPSAGSGSMPTPAPPPPPAAAASKKPKKAAARKASETPSASATGSRRSSRVAGSSRSNSPEKRDAPESETATPTSTGDAPAVRKLTLNFKRRPSPIKEAASLPPVTEDEGETGAGAEVGIAKGKGKKRKPSLAAKSTAGHEAAEEDAGSAKRAKTTHPTPASDLEEPSHKGRAVKRKGAARTASQAIADLFPEEEEEPESGPSTAPVVETSRRRGSKAIKSDPVLEEASPDRSEVENQEPALVTNRKSSKKKGYGSGQRTNLSTIEPPAATAVEAEAEPEDDDDLFGDREYGEADEATPPAAADATTKKQGSKRGEVPPVPKGKKQGSKLGKVVAAPEKMDVDQVAENVSSSSTKKKGQDVPSADAANDTKSEGLAPTVKDDLPLAKKKSFAEAVTGTSTPTAKEKRPNPIPKIAKLGGGGGTPAASALSTPSAADRKPVAAASGIKKPTATATPSTAKAAPSLLESTMATLKAVNAGTPTATKDGKGPAKPPAKPLAKGEWADEWVPTPQERKEIEASRGKREAERAKRMAWRKNPVNLQEAQDAYRLDSTIPRVIPPVEFGGLGIRTEGAPSKMVAALLAQRAQATSS